MGKVQDLSGETGASVEGVFQTTGIMHMHGIVPTNIAPLSAITASTTFYGYLGTVPKGATLVEGTIRSNAAGVGSSTTLDVFKVSSGTAPSSGTAIVTQVATNGLTGDTDSKLAVKTDGSQNLSAGDEVWVKIAGQGSETLKPVAVHLKFRL